MNANILDLRYRMRKVLRAPGSRATYAIIAATAAENGIPLLARDAKHFKAIKELQLRVFKP